MPSVSFWGTFNHHSTTSISLKVSSNCFGWSSAGISSWTQGNTYVPLLCVGSSTHLIFMLLWCCFMFLHKKKDTRRKGFFLFFFWSYITSVFREVALTGTHVTPHLLFPWEVLFCMPIVLLVGRKWSASYSEDESALIFYERRGLGYKGNKTQGRISPMLSQSNFQAKSPKTTLLG